MPLSNPTSVTQTGASVSGVLGGYVGAVRVADSATYGGGIADATAHIQGHLDAIATAGGGMLFIPKGVYKISNTLAVGANTTVSGAGIGKTILRGVAGAYAGTDFNGFAHYATLAMVAVDKSVVENLTVDHATNATQANGIIMAPDGAGTVATNCVVRFCEVLGYNSHQYLIWNFRAQHSKILFNKVDGGITAETPTSEQEGIECFGGLDVLIMGNISMNVGQNGIYLNSSQPNTAKTGIRVVDNYVSGCRYGIKLLNTNDSGGNPQHAHHIRIAGNQILNSWQNGIESTSDAGVLVSDLQIHGNAVDGGISGIRVYGATGALFENVSVSGNTVEAITGTADSAGVLLQAAADVDLSDNRILSGQCYGIAVLGGSRIRSKGNRVKTVQKQGLYADGVNDLSVRVNEFRNYNQANNSYAGVFVVRSSQVQVADNDFDTSRDYYAVWFGTGTDECEAYDNRFLYNSAVNPMIRNDGTNPGSTTAQFTAGQTQLTVNNTLVSRDCRLIITQEAGAPKAWTVARGSDLFVITLSSAAAGDEVFRYEIRQ